MWSSADFFADVVLKREKRRIFNGKVAEEE
jgi:hypothetical protein